MDTPRARSPRPLPPLSSKPTAPLPPPPPPRRSVSAATSPSHDFAFAFSLSASSSPFGGHLHPRSMSRAPVGRVASDLSHNSCSKASGRHPTTSYGTAGTEEFRDGAKSRAPHFFPGLGGVWSKESRSSGDVTTGGKKPAEEKRKDKTKRAVDVRQWVKKHMAAMVEQLRSSFHGRQADREQRRRPHSFSVVRDPNHGERWTRRRGQHLSSAPVSLRGSPANSGHLSVGGSVKASTSSEESTMEELQNAIEAAIAHCKNSISRAQQADDDGWRGDRTKQLQ